MQSKGNYIDMVLNNQFVFWVVFWVCLILFDFHSTVEASLHAGCLHRPTVIEILQYKYNSFSI